jgi:glycosyltransferase involved in cell wall biosynthesis
LIILESYAAGTPVIGTPVGAIPETMGDFASEWLTHGKDERAIADAMIRFLQGRLSHDPAALRKYAAEFHVDVGVDRLWKLCSES